MAQQAGEGADWKNKLNLPPKDTRIRTEVGFQQRLRAAHPATAAGHNLQPGGQQHQRHGPKPAEVEQQQGGRASLADGRTPSDRSSFDMFVTFWVIQPVDGLFWPAYAEQRQWN
jgi:hypothetical protein